MKIYHPLEESIKHLQWNADFCSIDKLTNATNTVLGELKFLQLENCRLNAEVTLLRVELAGLKTKNSKLIFGETNVH
jgi:hypothetical protein